MIPKLIGTSMSEWVQKKLARCKTELNLHHDRRSEDGPLQNMTITSRSTETALQEVVGRTERTICTLDASWALSNLGGFDQNRVGSSKRSLMFIMGELNVVAYANDSDISEILDGNFENICSCGYKDK